MVGRRQSFKDKTIAVTGASGTLGRSLLKVLFDHGARLIALTSKPDPVNVEGVDPGAIQTRTWAVGQEDQLDELWPTVDILILNHGINVHSDRSPEALQHSYEINTFSQWRLLNGFLQTSVPEGKTGDGSEREVWVNTSEAEVSPALSPLYELSKRTLGDWVTLRRLDAPCVIRKLILGPFRSDLNPIGIMRGDAVAQKVVKLAQQDVRNIIVTINPLTFLLFPLREGAVSLYFKLLTRPPSPATETEEPGMAKL